MVALAVKDRIILVCLYNYRLLTRIHFSEHFFTYIYKYRNVLEMPSHSDTTTRGHRSSACPSALSSTRRWVPTSVSRAVGARWAAGANLRRDSHRDPRELHAPQWRLLNLIELHYQKQNLTHIQRTACCPKIATSRS